MAQRFLFYATLLCLIRCTPSATGEKESLWLPPDSVSMPNDEIGYGRALIRNTSFYLGPKGRVAQISNGMNCQNCHLNAGTKVFGNHYGAVAPTYPKFRERSGTIETIEKRINDCLERSLNGKPLDSGSVELSAMKAYILWVGSELPKGVAPAGSGIVDLPFLNRAASPDLGKGIYQTKCVACHGKEGEGILRPDSMEYVYPPVWGANSFNVSAGLFRLSRMAGFIKANMPLVADSTGTLTNEEAWDVAAFLVSQPRPQNKFAADWPDIGLKPIDHPFGPYLDGFSEQQHKFGPFGPIEDFYKLNRTKK